MRLRRLGALEKILLISSPPNFNTAILSLRSYVQDTYNVIS